MSGTIVLGKKQEVIGDKDKDLVLKTKGKVKIQQGSKFIDLISEGELNIPKSIKSVPSKSKIPSTTGFYFVEEEGLIYAVINKKITPLSGEGIGSDLDIIKKLSELTDTSITQPKNDDILLYKNGKWVNSSIKIDLDEDTIQDLIDDSITENNEELNSRIEYTAKGWKDVKETIDMMFDPSGDYFTNLIKPLVVETSYLVVGTESQQFDLFNIVFRPNKKVEEYNRNYFSWKTIDNIDHGILKHHVVDGVGETWKIFPSEGKNEIFKENHDNDGVVYDEEHEFYLSYSLDSIIKYYKATNSDAEEMVLDETPFYVYAKCSKEPIEVNGVEEMIGTIIISTEKKLVTSEEGFY